MFNGCFFRQVVYFDHNVSLLYTNYNRTYSIFDVLFTIIFQYVILFSIIELSR